MGVVLCCLAAVPCRDAHADQAPAVVETPLACDLPFSLWPCFQNERFLVFSDSREFDFPVTEEFLDSFSSSFLNTFRKAGFKVRPLQKQMVWVCITDAQRYQHYSVYADGMDLSSLVSYYSTQTNCVAFHWVKPTPASPTQFASAQTAMPSPPSEVKDDFLRRITHELAHQLAFNCGIQKRGILYPLWVSEGLALNFEFGDTFESQADRNAERKQRLTKLVKQDMVLPLEHLVTTSRLPRSNEERCDLYAECWGLYYFLSHNYPVQFREYIQFLYGLDPVYRSPSELLNEFEYFFGDTRGHDRAWRTFLSELQAAGSSH